MMGGVWLKNILDMLKKADKGEKTPKMVGYASVSLLNNCGTGKERITRKS